MLAASPVCPTTAMFSSSSSRAIPCRIRTASSASSTRSGRSAVRGQIISSTSTGAGSPSRSWLPRSEISTPGSEPATSRTARELRMRPGSASSQSRAASVTGRPLHVSAARMISPTLMPTFSPGELPPRASEADTRRCAAIAKLTAPDGTGKITIRLSASVPAVSPPKSATSALISSSPERRSKPSAERRRPGVSGTTPRLANSTAAVSALTSASRRRRGYRLQARSPASADRREPLPGRVARSARSPGAGLLRQPRHRRPRRRDGRRLTGRE